MRALLIPLLLLIPTLVLGQVFKWVDADGKVHYSDRPVSGAETLGVPVKKTPPAQQQPAPNQASLGPYAQFEILAPEANATVRDAEGKVQVGLVLDPALMEGHRLQILVDGAPLSGEIPGTQLQINGMPFGSHQVQAQILDAGGSRIASSSVVRFHLRKPESP
jgi:hypothetical protein